MRGMDRDATGPWQTTSFNKGGSNMAKSTTLSPFSSRRWLGFPEVDRLWSQLMGFPFYATEAEREWATHWSPPVDIIENAEGYQVRAELAGVDPNDVDVSLTGDVLTIRGHKHVEEKREQENWTTRERIWGKFERSFTLPSAVNAENIVAETKNGVLTVHIPKAKEAKPHKIKVKSGA